MSFEKLATRLRAAREKRGLSQAALATKAGLSRIYITKLEAGERAPSLATLEELAKALRVKVIDLLK
jgi:transcriptional regulator with XRE-family HTH domain